MITQLQGRGSPWAGFGEAVGTGLGAGLQQLAQHKMQELVERKQHIRQQQEVQQRAQFWENINLPGGQKLSPQEAVSIARQDPKLQQEFFERLQGASFGMGQEKSPQGLPKQSVGPALQQSFAPAVVQPDQQRLVEQKALLDQYNQLPKDQKKAFLQQYKQRKNTPEKRTIEAINGQPLITQAVPQTAAALIGPNSKDKLAQEKQLLSEKKFKQAESEKALGHQERLLKHFDKEIQEANKSKEAAEEQNKSLDLIQEKLQGGNVDSQAYVQFLESAGLDGVEGLYSPDTQVAKKAIANLQKGVKEIYGGTIPVAEMNQFLKTLPTLLHSPEGVRDITAMMRSLNDMRIAKAESMQQILDRNNGYPTSNFRKDVKDSYERKKKELDKKFRAEMKRALTEKEKSRGSSTLTNVAASGAGYLTRTAGPALIGAGIGSVIPGVGNVIGGALGGLSGLAVPGIIKTLKGIFHD